MWHCDGHRVPGGVFEAQGVKPFQDQVCDGNLTSSQSKIYHMNIVDKYRTILKCVFYIINIAYIYMI